MLDNFVKLLAVHARQCHDRASSHTACPELGEDKFTVSVYCFVPGASSDPAVQSYELRIQRSGYSQILIENESCRGRTKNTVRARTASLAMQPAQRDAKVAWLSHLGLRLYTEPTRRKHGSQTMAMRT